MRHFFAKRAEIAFIFFHQKFIIFQRFYFKLSSIFVYISLRKKGKNVKNLAFKGLVFWWKTNQMKSRRKKKFLPHAHYLPKFVYKFLYMFAMVHLRFVFSLLCLQLLGHSVDEFGVISPKKNISLLTRSREDALFRKSVISLFF